MKAICFPIFVVDFYPEQNLTRMGGNSLNSAVWLKDNGIKNVAVLGAVGNDEMGKSIRSFLESKEIDTSHLYTLDGITANNKMLVDENGERFSKEGSWVTGVKDSLILTKKDFEYINTFDLAISGVTDINLSNVIYNLNEQVKLSVDFSHYNNYNHFKQYLDKTYIAYMAGDESFFTNAQKASKEFNKPVVVTMGHKGSMGFWKGEEIFQPAIKVDKVIDTTGCGDAYQAACSQTFLRTGHLKQAMNHGAKASAKILEYFGGVGC